jgi:hypothetical protein
MLDMFSEGPRGFRADQQCWQQLDGAAGATSCLAVELGTCISELEAVVAAAEAAGQ